jgi:drug/metabolite transporter (DMT)-like permease
MSTQNLSQHTRLTLRRQRLVIVLALLAVYIIWGSTYLGISIAIRSIPPLLMAGTRFIISGTILLAYTRVRGFQQPTRRQWGYALMFGVMILGIGNGAVTLAEQTVSSHVAAIIIGSVPLWMIIWSGVGGKPPGALELAGVLLGFAGIILLNFGSDLSANPVGILLLLVANISWSLGSYWKRGAATARGVVGAGAEMLCAGVVMLLTGLLTGERLTEMPTTESLVAFVYLFIFGGIIAYTAYVYLLDTVRPTLATSYAYINPVIAVILGALIGGEAIGEYGLLALICIVGGVALIMFRREKSPTQSAGEA